MKLEYLDEGVTARIWVTGPFWQLLKARKLVNGLTWPANTVQSWESCGLTFQITLHGRVQQIMRLWKELHAAKAAR